MELWKKKLKKAKKGELEGTGKMIKIMKKNKIKKK